MTEMAAPSQKHLHLIKPIANATYQGMTNYTCSYIHTNNKHNKSFLIQIFE